MVPRKIFFDLDDVLADVDSDFGKRQIELCRTRLTELVPKYDDLAF